MDVIIGSEIFRFHVNTHYSYNLPTIWATVITLTQQVFPTILQSKFLNIPQQTSLRKVIYS